MAINLSISYEFIVRKFWRHFVSEVIENNDEIAEISAKFKKSDFDIRTLYRAILTSKTFKNLKIK